MRKHRRFLVPTALLVGIIALSTGCEFVAGIFNPLLGSWRGTLGFGSLTQDLTLEFRSDGTYTQSGTWSQSESSGTIEGEGTFAQDKAAETITLVGTVTYRRTSGPPAGLEGTMNTDSTASYSIDGNTLTLIDEEYGAMTFDRQ